MRVHNHSENGKKCGTNNNFVGYFSSAIRFPNQPETYTQWIKELSQPLQDAVKEMVCCAVAIVNSIIPLQ